MPRSRRGRTAGVRRFHRQLDVVRVVLEAAHDHDVLDPAGDEQLAVVDEPEIAGAEERALAGVGEVRVEDVARVSSGRRQ